MSPLDYQKPVDARREEWKRRRVRWFGPSRDDVWTAFADDVGGEMIEGGFCVGKKVVAKAGLWRVTLDLHQIDDVTYTRFRVPYVNPDNFRFDVHRRNVLTDLAAYFGFRDVEIGDATFDRDFVINGTDPAKLRRLFANRRLRELLAGQKLVRLKILDDQPGWFGRPKFPARVDELRCTVMGVVKDLDRLKQLFAAVGETLQTLREIGSACEDDPGIKL